MVRASDVQSDSPDPLGAHLMARMDALEGEQARMKAALGALQAASAGPFSTGNEPVAGTGTLTVYHGLEVVTEHGPSLHIVSSGSGMYIESKGGSLYTSSAYGPALYAEATDADAVVASSLGAQSSGLHALGGGVRGGMGTSPRPCGVFAEGGSGDGVYATGEDTAVRGVSGTGYGASFAGGQAPLHLLPAHRVGPPAAGVHRPGTVFVDARVTLWLCVRGGTPGTWKRIVVR